MSLEGSIYSSMMICLGSHLLIAAEFWDGAKRFSFKTVSHNTFPLSYSSPVQHCMHLQCWKHHSPFLLLAVVQAQCKLRVCCSPQIDCRIFELAVLEDLRLILQLNSCRIASVFHLETTQHNIGCVVFRLRASTTPPLKHWVDGPVRLTSRYPRDKILQRSQNHLWLIGTLEIRRSTCVC